MKPLEAWRIISSNMNELAICEMHYIRRARDIPKNKCKPRLCVMKH